MEWKVPPPTLVAGVAFTAGDYFSMALDASGNIWTWGRLHKYSGCE